MAGIGIDTGGTYTDAVIYGLETGEIRASAKSLTTRGDLKQGIKHVLCMLPEEELKQAESLALSTTLATNACVEDRGGRAKLIFIGVLEKTFDEVGKSYGIENKEDVYFLDCEISNVAAKGTQPDWEQFRRELPDLLKGYAGVSVVQLFSRQFAGNYEIQARDIIRESFSGPIVLGKDLFSDLNAIKRGAGALLNARLISVIQDFLEAVGEVFAGFGISIPPVIVRSDGSLMNEGFACERPVETLLCGSAATSIGAMHLAKEQNAMIVDMGGTTTDVALIKDGVTRRVLDGIQIGSWKTFVKGLFVDTFGLGGDTAVHFNKLKQMNLENYRVIPISDLASRYPQIVPRLEELVLKGERDDFYRYEFLTLVKMPEDMSEYLQCERRLCEALQDGPLILEDAAAAVNRDLYNFRYERLEREGIVLRAGLTPTDAMVLKGDYKKFHVRAARLAVRYLAGVTGTRKEEIADRIYDLVVRRLYCNLVRILLQTEASAFQGKNLDAQMEHLIALSYLQKAEELAGKEGKGQNAGMGKGMAMTRMEFCTDYTLVGVGAPTHVFLETVAKMLGTHAVIPPHAAVANAVGAIVGNVTAVVEAEICPIYKTSGIDGYCVIFDRARAELEEYEDAFAFLKKRGTELAGEEARRRGANGELTIRIAAKSKERILDTETMVLSEKYEIVAQGKIQ